MNLSTYHIIEQEVEIDIAELYTTILSWVRAYSKWAGKRINSNQTVTDFNYGKDTNFSEFTNFKLFQIYCYPDLESLEKQQLNTDR
jgi:hypothetical protein